MDKPVIATTSTCAGYLVSSATTFINLQKEIYTRTQKEKCLNKERLRVALLERNIALEKY